jgi:hypothetical protein
MICVAVVRTSALLGDTSRNSIGGVLLALASIAFIISMAYVGRDLPSTGTSARSEKSFVGWFLIGFGLAALLFTAAWSFLALSIEKDSGFPVWFCAGFGALLHTLAWGIGLRSWNPLALAAAFVTGILGGAMVGQMAIQQGLPFTHPVGYVATAPPLLLCLALLAGVLFVGIASYREMIDDRDREWWARAGAWVLILIAAWLFFSSVVLYGPALFLLTHKWALGLGATGGLSGVISTLIGWYSKTPLRKSKDELSRLDRVLEALAIRLFAPLFTISLIASMSLALTYSIGYLANGRGPDSPSAHFRVLQETPWWWFFLAMILLFAVGFGLGWLFSVNRFSLLGMYRNRLIRAYLGASRQKKSRQPHPFTGFDVHDNILLKDLRKGQPAGEGNWPLHIINMALNITKGKELAWQNRKALSFTASPLHCGSSHRLIGYLPPELYTDAGGLSLGTAMGISGAAASPNMGYHSSAILTFLMALFNARLGAWLPNPGPPGRKAWQKGGPDCPLVLAEESLGMTSADKKWVYLSDGGHFENLGLYEMVRRRCHLIVVSDASADKDYASAIHKIRVDQGIQLEYVKSPQIWHKSTPGAKRCALLRIPYRQVDGPKAPDGFLIYLKPVLRGDEPQDLLRYSFNNQDFPHQSTADQFFDEAQFESYRMLGFLTVAEICEAIGGTVGEDGMQMSRLPILMEELYL